VLFATCGFLFIITFFPKIIIGMDSSKMNIDTALHYHSLVTNIILGYSAVVCIGITLFYSFPGQSWKIHNLWLFFSLLGFFIFAMYLIFLRGLNKRIAYLNKH